MASKDGGPVSLSLATLEVCLRAVTYEVKSFVDGGTFEETWESFARTVAAGAELDAELTRLEAGDVAEGDQG